MNDVLRESNRQVVTSVKHKLLGSHISNKQWVPFGQEYGEEGPTYMEKLSSSWLPH